MKNIKKLKEFCSKTSDERSSKRATILAGVESAEKELKDAAEDKRNATEAQDYYEASEAERKASEMLEFYQISLKGLDSGTGMTQAEYEDSKETIRAHAVAAAVAFRKQAENVAQLLSKAYDDYDQAIKEANEAAEALDEAANVLQVEHGKAWRNHATRYNRTTAQDIYYDRESQFVGADPVRVATWRLLERVKGWPVEGERRYR